MTDTTSALQASLDFAERMVRKGYGTPEQAALVCGVNPPDLQARLAAGRGPAQDGQQPLS